MNKIENFSEDIVTLLLGSNSEIFKIGTLPIKLKTLGCSGTNISVIENLPLGLVKFYYNKNSVKYVDNVEINRINFTLRGYSAIKRIQFRMKRRFKIKNKAAKVIQAGMHNWLFKPYLNDGKNGIVPRLAMRELGLVE